MSVMLGLKGQSSAKIVFRLKTVKVALAAATYSITDALKMPNIDTYCILTLIRGK